MKNSRRFSAVRATRAFTLVELLVVIIILGILAAVVIPRVIGRTDGAKLARALSDIKAVETSLDSYRLDVGAYPSTEEGLQALVSNVGNSPKWGGPYLKNGQLPQDPWGQPYIYKCPPEHGTDYDISCVAPDGKSAINSWEIK